MERVTDYTLSAADFRIGQRVQLHPALDAWMMGDRYGEITKLPRMGSTGPVWVKCDRSGKIRWLNVASISPID